MKAELTSFAGPTGIGALCVLAVYLVIDSQQATFFYTVETYAKTATWGVIIAAPLLVISYIAGIAVITAAELVLQNSFGPSFLVEADDLFRLSTMSVEKSPLAQVYSELRQDRSILAGSSIALFLLACAAIVDVKNLPGLRKEVFITAFFMMLLSGVIFYFAGIKGRNAHAIAQKIIITKK